MTRFMSPIQGGYRKMYTIRVYFRHFITGKPVGIIFTVDTGCLISCMSKSVFNEIGITDPTNQLKFGNKGSGSTADLTAPAIKTIETYHHNVQIGNILLDDKLFNIALDEPKDLDNLLGLDFLANFELLIGFGSYMAIGDLIYASELDINIDWGYVHFAEPVNPNDLHMSKF